MRHTSYLRLDKTVLLSQELVLKEIAVLTLQTMEILARNLVKNEVEQFAQLKCKPTNFQPNKTVIPPLWQNHRWF